MQESASCAALYEQLSKQRYPFLKRARDCASVTIPTLMPPAGHTASTDYPTPYQSVGARGVNNLASKLLLALLPQTPFFRLRMDDFTLAQASQNPSARAEAEKAFNRIERTINDEVEAVGLRPAVFDGLKHLIVTGNVLIYLDKDNRPRLFTLDSYVTQRAPDGTLLQAIMEEEVALSKLDPEVRALVEDEAEDKKEDKRDAKDDTVKVYTRYYLNEQGKYRLYQEVGGKRIPGTEGLFKPDEGPVFALRWISVGGEDYGRSHVEEYLGDLIALEGLSKAILEGTAASVRLLIMVNPGGSTREDDVATAENGAVISGNANDVSTLQAEKQADLRVAQEVVREITDRLQFAFLMNTAVQRHAERVTAAEIRWVIGELEDTLGGVYSLMSQQFQQPLASRFLASMAKSKRIPKLPKGVVKPVVVTGLDALGRGHDLQKLETLIQTLAPFGEAAIRYLNLGDLATRAGTALGIDMDGLVKTEAQLQQEQQAQMQQMMQQQAIQTAGDMATRATPEAVKAVAAQQSNNGN